MVAAAAKLQEQTKATSLESILAARRSSEKQETAADPASELKSNPVYQVLFSTEIAPQDKPAALAAILAAPETEEQARTTMKEFQAVTAFAAAQRVALAEALIKAQQSDTTAELQKSLRDLNNGVIDFQKNLKPITDILDAVFDLTVNNQDMTAFKEIQEEQQAKKEADAKRNHIAELIASEEAVIKSAESEIVTHRNNKGWFGGIKATSQTAIERLTMDIDRAKLNLDDLQKQLADLLAPTFASQLDPNFQKVQGSDG